METNLKSYIERVFDSNNPTTSNKFKRVSDGKYRRPSLIEVKDDAASVLIQNIIKEADE